MLAINNLSDSDLFETRRIRFSLLPNWLDYESRKNEIRHKKLSPIQYEEEMNKLIDELGI